MLNHPFYVCLIIALFHSILVFVTNEPRPWSAFFSRLVNLPFLLSYWYLFFVLSPAIFVNLTFIGWLIRIITSIQLPLTHTVCLCTLLVLPVPLLLN